MDGRNNVYWENVATKYKKQLAEQCRKRDEESLQYKNTIWLLEEKIKDYENLCKYNKVDTLIVKIEDYKRRLLTSNVKPSSETMTHIELVCMLKAFNVNPKSMSETEKKDLSIIVKNIEDKGINDRYTKFLKDFVSKF